MIYNMYAKYNLLNTFVNITLFAGFISLYLSLETIKKYKKFSIFFSSFLSVILVLGTNLELNSDIKWNILLSLNIFTLTFSFYPLILKLANINWKIANKLKSNNFLKTFLIILFLNMLAYLAMYPGIYHYDAGYQIMEIIKPNVQITNHFSYLYCLVLGNLVRLGKILFDSYAIGFGIFILLQSILLTYVYTKIVCFVNERLNSSVFKILMIIFFGVFPLSTTMLVSATQDTIFAAFFALCLIHIYQFIENDNYFNEKMNIIKFIALSFLLCVSRNNGIYVLLFIIPFAIIVLKGKRIRAFILILVPIILFKAYDSILLPKLGVVKAEPIREMSSVPSQQFARVYTYDKLSINEQEKLDLFYNLEAFNVYELNQSIADSMKGGLDVNYTEEHLFDYFKFWILTGINHPINYTEAFLLNNLGYWFPNKNYYDSRIYHNYLYYDMLDAKIWNKDYVSIKRHSIISPYNNLNHIIIEKNQWKYIPILNTLFTMGFYFIIISYSLIFNIINRRYKLLLPYSFIFGLYFTLLLSPVAIFRYFYSIFIIIPICISDIITIKKSL